MNLRYMLAGVLLLLWMNSSVAVGVEWYYFTAKKTGVLVYSELNRDSQVVASLPKGLTVAVKRKPSGCEWENNKGWVHIDEQQTLGAGTDAKTILIPSGWAQVGDFYRESDFKKVSSWPFKYLIVDWQEWSENYCFNPDGSGIYSITPNEGGKDQKVTVFVVDNIVNFSPREDEAVGRSDAIFERGRMRLCPVAYQGDECDKFYKTRGGYIWHFALTNDEGSKSKKIYEQRCLRIGFPDLIE